MIDQCASSGSGAGWTVASTVVQALVALSGLILSIVLFRWQLRVHRDNCSHERLSLEHSIRSGWIAIDLAVAQDPALLSQYDHIFHPTTGGPIALPAGHIIQLDPARKRWIAYAILNVLISRQKSVELLASSSDNPEKYANEILMAVRSSLERLLCDEDIRIIIAQGGYEVSFKHQCAELLKMKYCDKCKVFYE